LNIPINDDMPATSSGVLDAYIARSWRSNAQRQRDKGIEFVIGKREGPYMWNLEGTHRLIDCGTAGGVHGLGHRHPEVVAALQRAIDEGRDTGFWTMPNLEYLKLQDTLAYLAPAPELDRSVITLASTVSVELATMFSFCFTGRQKMLAYRHGYHGHTGFAALVTGSLEEGVIEHYNMPAEHVDFMPTYGDPDVLPDVITEELAGVIVEPMDYETFAPAPRGFLEALQAECNKKGVLFILDETRTGLGRTGKMWACEHYDISPDMLITGKGLSGGMYPVSAVMTRREIYETCMNGHKFSYISSLGGNEISCIVGRRVLEISSDPQLLSNVHTLSAHFEKRFGDLCERYSEIIAPGTIIGANATLRILDKESAGRLFQAVFEQGVICHSISVIDPCVLKFFPVFTIDTAVVDEIAEAVARAIESL